jgi:hypothetical protein
MPTVTNLLTRGNGKLGEGIHSWSLPAVETCPGRSTLCESVCYARSGRFRTQRMQDRLQANLDATLQADFEKRMVREITRRGVHILRIHVAGDFYDPAYAAKWRNIARRCKRSTMYAYTRSWRLPEYRVVFEEMAGLKNFHLWFSVDAETGIPTDIPKRVRLAYMQTDEDQDPRASDLVFRIPELRDTKVKRVGLTLVCPTEQGAPVNDRSCTSCRRCFS